MPETGFYQPDSSSKTSMTLVQPTETEKLQAWELNGTAWRGALSQEAYVRRETHLSQQDFTKSGRLKYWILTTGDSEPSSTNSAHSLSPRPILAACETFQKRILVRRGSGELEETICHGIGSVYCDTKYRGKGYASRMIDELARKLDKNEASDNTGQGNLSILFSDIGKIFYDRKGWHPYTSDHICLPSAEPRLEQGVPVHETEIRELFAPDLPDLCRIDEARLRQSMVQLAASPEIVRIGIIPDVATIDWHHAREDFFIKERFGQEAKVKGAMATSQQGHKVWAIWTRMYGNSANENNTLYILRISDGDSRLHVSKRCTEVVGVPGAIMPQTHSEDDRALVRCLKGVLQVAQHEAFKWDMASVEIWNPTAAVHAAVKDLCPSAELVHREKESIASLRWQNGKEPPDTSIHWLHNEKYGWC